MLCRNGRTREIVRSYLQHKTHAVELEMKRKQPELELEIAKLDLELARTKAQQTTSEKQFKLEIAKLNLEITQKKAQQASTKEQKGPKFLESTYKAALPTKEVERARKLVPLLNTTKSSQKDKARNGKSGQGTQNGLPTVATKLSPKPRGQDINQKKPTLKPAAHSQKPNQGSKRKAILDQVQDQAQAQAQAHIVTNRPKEAAKVLNEMSAKLSKQMEALVDDLKDNLTKRDEIYLEKINKHAEAVLQDTNAKSLKILTDKVSDMSKSNLEYIKETFTTVMTMVHEERERADNKHEELSRDVTKTQKQLKKMVQTNKELTEKVNQLQKDAVKKGKKSQVGRVQQSPTLPPFPVPVAQVIHMFGPSVQPGSSSGATFTSRRAPAINYLRYDNQNLQGVDIVEEEHSDLLFLGPPETCEQMMQKEKGKGGMTG